jgi:hypothetical protein
MILRERYGAVFELVPLGYHAAEAADRDGRNSLDIKVSGSSPGGSWTGSWTGVRPCLLTWELPILHEWLRACAESEVGTWEPFLQFVRPDLDFEFVWGDPEIVVRVGASGALTGAASADDDGRRVVNLMLSRGELLNAADELRAEAARYPER